MLEYPFCGIAVLHVEFQLEKGNGHAFYLKHHGVGAVRVLEIVGRIVLFSPVTQPVFLDVLGNAVAKRRRYLRIE